MTTKIIFIEHPSELKYLNSLESSQIIVITTHPLVKVKLEDVGISCIDTHELFDQQGHKEIAESTAAIVNNIRHSFLALSQEIVKHAYERTAIFYLRFFLNYVFSQIFIIQASVERFKPDEVILLPYDSFQNIEASLDKADNLIGNIVELFCQSNKIKVTRLYNANLKCNYKKTRSFYYNKFEIILFKMSLFWLGKIKAEKKILIAVDDTYGMPALMEEAGSRIGNSLPVYLSIQKKTIKARIKEMILGKSFSLLSLPIISTKEDGQFKRLWHICINDIRSQLKLHKRSFDFYGINISKFSIDYIENGLANELRNLNGRVSSLFQVIHKVHPTIVFSQHAVGASYAIGEICREMKIPGVLISHGSHTPHQGKIASNEWNEHAKTLFNTHFPFVAIQTPWASKFFDMQKEMLSIPIDTGPLLFANKSAEKINRKQLRIKIYKQHADKNILIHAGTPKLWRAFRPWVYETLDEYVENINKIIQVVDRIQGVYLAVRFRPIGGITSDYLRKILIKSDCYGIYDQGSFDEHLLAADRLISYSSTTLEEALQNKIPILQFDPDNKYQHIPTSNSFDSEQSVVKYAGNCQELYEAVKRLNCKDNGRMDESEWSPHILEKDSNWISKMYSN
jgi:hypothetical protein